MKKKVITPAGIQTKLLPAAEVKRASELLNRKIAACTSRKTAESEYFMKLASCGFETVNFEYDFESIGFKPKELLLFPEGDFAMCAGISQNNGQAKVWFVCEKSCQGIFHFPEINNVESFAKAGFAKVSPAG